VRRPFDFNNALSKFDVANVKFPVLQKAASAYFLGSLPEHALHGLTLAEAVRRYVGEDRSPPGAQNQTRVFELPDILDSWSFSPTPHRVKSVLDTLLSTGEVVDAIPEAGILAPKNCFFLTETGVDEGLQLITNFRRLQERLDRDDNAESLSQSVIDSTDWTGLSKAITHHHSLVIRAKAKSLLLAIMQSDADIETRTDACKRVEAAILLLEAPNVPWREIVNLLAHPTVTAFLAALNLIQFILGFAQ